MDDLSHPLEPTAFRRALRHYGALSVMVLMADQLSKWWAVAALTDAFAGAQTLQDRISRFMWRQHPMRGDAVAVFDGFWHYRYVENPGAAWGFLSGSGSALRTPFFLCVSLFAMGLIVVYFKRSLAGQQLLRWALALVFGGALGNFIDRVRLGYVIDFIDWHWYDKAAWPTFNVADAAITVGVALLLIDMIVNKPPAVQAATKSLAGDGGTRT